MRFKPLDHVQIEYADPTIEIARDPRFRYVEDVPERTLHQQLFRFLAQEVRANRVVLLHMAQGYQGKCSCCQHLQTICASRAVSCVNHLTSCVDASILPLMSADSRTQERSEQLEARRAKLEKRHPQTFLRTFEICYRLGISDDTWYRWEQAGQAPARVPGLPGKPRWRVADIEDFERGLRQASGRRRRHFASARG